MYRSSDSKLIGTYEYDLWGKPIGIKEATPGIDTDGILEKNPLRYRSYYYDSETDFYNLNARYYDPAIRRFIGADVLFDWAGLTISVIDLAHNPTDSLAYAGVACDVIDIFFTRRYTGEAFN